MGVIDVVKDGSIYSVVGHFFADARIRDDTKMVRVVNLSIPVSPALPSDKSICACLII